MNDAINIINQDFFFFFRSGEKKLEKGIPQILHKTFLAQAHKLKDQQFFTSLRFLMSTSADPEP